MSRGRIHYMPFGVHEIYEQQPRLAKKLAKLVVDRKLLLIIPTYAFYFVHPDNQALHGAIRTGLEKAHADGSFVRFFQVHTPLSDPVRRADLWNRRPFSIDNPHMTPESRAIPVRFFFNDGWLTRRHPGR